MKKLEKTKHCCGQITRYLGDPRINIHYCSKFREYATHLTNSPAKQCYFYCPWCGSKLPESLRDEYFDILKKEYNIVAAIFTEDIPEEFQTDEWWKKRGL